MSVSASCPGHISGYFRKITGPSGTTTGSIGAGVVIEPGVTVTVSTASKTSVSIRQILPGGSRRQVADHSPPIASALRRIGTDARVITECRLPIGAGFGLSAAALLATLTAVNELEGLGLTEHEIALIAHETEVEHRTGLGDVAACQDGGRVVRTGAGIDGEIHRLYDLPGPLCAVSFGPILTPTVLGSAEKMRHVERAFPTMKPASPAEFFGICQDFSRRSGLETPEVARVLTACRAEKIMAGMTMLGNGVFAYGERAYPVLRQFGDVYPCTMARAGARLTGGDP